MTVTSLIGPVFVAFCLLCALLYLAVTAVWLIESYEGWRAERHLRKAGRR